MPALKYSLAAPGAGGRNEVVVVALIAGTAPVRVG